MKNNLIKLALRESSDGKNLSNSELVKISKQYERTIQIPKTKLVHQLILCSVGLVGAGKTTVIKPICNKLKLIRISTDEIRHILKNNGFNYLRAVDVAEKIILKYIGQGYSLGIDGDSIAPEIQKYFKKLAQRYELKLIWIHIKPPERFILNKLKNYKHTWLFNDANEAILNYKRRKPLHRKYLSSINFDFKFDTSKNNLDQQIKKFLIKLNNNLKNESFVSKSQKNH